MQALYDIAIIGGGINGAAIARDAAGRGLKVALIEAGDLAGETSSASTKLIHGGLRYLEHYEFRLVRESLNEREIMLKSAPHIIQPVRIILPHHRKLRPAWLLRLGLFIYDHLGGKSRLPGTIRQRLDKPPFSGILKGRFTKGFEFSDCWADDARLVLFNAMDAAQRGADILLRNRCTGLCIANGHWQIARESGKPIAAKTIVNAAGRHVDQILALARPGKVHDNLRLIKGSHIIVPKVYQGDHLYMFQADDQRIAFAIPWLDKYTLIGTTDVPYALGEGKPKISEMEISYLLALVNQYFLRPIQREDIVATYAGVRPLFDDKSQNASTITRDYIFDLDRGEDGDLPAILSIFGGKITTARELAQHALEKLSDCLAIDNRPWTANSPLPGGDIDNYDFATFAKKMAQKYHWLPMAELMEMLGRHGTLIDRVIGKSRNREELGQYFGAGLYEAEIRYMISKEWAKSAEDILWRRSKAGLSLDVAQQYELQKWLDAEYPAR